MTSKILYIISLAYFIISCLFVHTPHKFTLSAFKNKLCNIKFQKPLSWFICFLDALTTKFLLVHTLSPLYYLWNKTTFSHLQMRENYLFLHLTYISLFVCIYKYVLCSIAFEFLYLLLQCVPKQQHLLKLK